LKRRATKLAAFLNTLEGYSCNHSEGAMYLFPQVSPKKKQRKN
jgi:aspartate/methionine/tyrosine aminotransferase